MAMSTHLARVRRTLAALSVIATFGSLAACGSDTQVPQPTVSIPSVDGSQTLPTLPNDATTSDPSLGMIPPAIAAPSVMSTGTVTILPGSGPMVVVFGAHWCPHCNRELPPLAEHLKSAPPADVKVYLVSSSEQPGTVNYPPSSWLEKMGWPNDIAPTVDDGKSENGVKWGLDSFPYFVALDKDGKVVARASGEIGIKAFDDLVSAAAA